MKSLVKKGLWITTFFLLGAFLTDFCQKQTKGFTQSKIAKAFTLDSGDLSFSSLDNQEEILTVLDQPFHYLRKGNSAYVFVSDDDKYVLKFLRSPKILPPFWVKLNFVQWIFPTYCKELTKEKQKEMDLMFTSYGFASKELKGQTGILYSHLHPTSNLNKKITFYDRIKVKHAISADSVAFALQRKAVPFCPYFKNLAKENKKEEMQLLLQEFAALLHERAIKGVYDNDISPNYNLGIFEGHFMAFDLDGLKSCEVPPDAESMQKHMLQDGKKMLRWLKSVSPDWVVFLKQEINTLSHLS